MRQLSFKTKMFLLCILMAAVSMMIGFVARKGLQDVGRSYEKVTGEAMPSLERLNEMFLAYRSVRINLRSLGLANLTPEQAEEYVQGAKDQIAHYEKLNNEYRQDSFEPGEEALYNDLNKSWLHFRDIGETSLKLYAERSPESLAQLNHIFRFECPEAAKQYTVAVNALKKFHTDFAQSTTETARRTSDRINLVILMAIIVGVSLGLTIGFFFSSAVTKAVSQVARALAENANVVESASQEIAGSTQILSQASTEQAASVQQTAASLDEITAMIAKASSGAASTAESSGRSQEKAEEGRQAVQEMLAAMTDINSSNELILNQVAENAQQMHEIQAVIQEIGAKTKIINEIVFQTKLLSFNASVEAARAGENGKGFAVVAEEVGNLAQMSGGAAKDISDMLDSSMSRVKRIAEETQLKVGTLVKSAKDKVETGTEVANRCSDILSEIVSNVANVAELSKEISQANREQSQGVSEINQAIGQLDAVTQKNAQAGAQTATAAEGLSAQSKALKESVETLQLVINGDRRPSSSAAS